ncbi:uncharacterized protein [Physcomitrium patens]|uniref:7-cyano-7-deazaguanine synthase n=1 Tax=Physcomitrium patens TaxID=3218 RepID=A0A2K1IRC6_PHYPA|nr:uncharacterized protein LOC112274140 isoform X1 [Physcomitrium patens]PNR31832.1 hypothetical protein PHYPA_025955 [Physcomitrium patens]|eukprot:XP_024359138.1 uncharacterized protein LOC112274140 isoform X1 [Physcomitrella patens]
MAGPSSVVLMSGGIESAVLLYNWRSSSALLHPLYINYGQRGAAMEERASDKICNNLGLELSRIDMSAVGNKFRELQHGAKSFVPLPHRNLVILGLAASYASQVGSSKVALGLNKDDLGSYSSASQNFMDSFRSTAASLEPPVTLIAPLSHFTKAEVIRLGKRLGVPFADTYSCMVGRPVHCGRCHQCRSRQLAFASASEQEPAGFYER